MPTVKMSSGKVVTQAGKVSCSCCSTCCMYPATQAVSADLPDAITLLGVGSLSKSGTDYGNTTNGVILESGVWAKYIGGVRTTQACLIDGDGNLTPGNNSVEDQFEPAYEVSNQYIPNWPDNQPIVVTRYSKCQWAYTDPLYYVGEGFTGGNHERDYTIVSAVLTWEYDGYNPGYWYLQGEYLDPEGTEYEEGEGIYWLNTLGFGTQRFGTQHTPDGDYNESGNVTVSVP